MGETHQQTNRGRALRLLAGGALGGVIGWVAGLAGCLWGFGPQVWPEALLAGAAAMLFFALGQLAQVVFAEVDPMQLFVVALSSYLIRAVGLAAFAVVVTRLLPQLNPLVVAVVVVAVVIGWLAVEIWVFSRMRIPAFDAPQAKTD